MSSTQLERDHTKLQEQIPPDAPGAAAQTGSDAVCFTAGLEGLFFGAGTVHAYLAADRKPPAVVAGISMGALTAAAMQRSYKDLAALPASTDRTRREIARWGWFRRYLHEIIREPLGVLWDAIPNQSDFFADMPTTKDPATDKELEGEEAQAARERDLLVHLGRWLAGLPITIGHVTRTIVSYVRYKEGYGSWRRARYYRNLVGLLLRLSLYLLRPAWYCEKYYLSVFRARAQKRPRFVPAWVWRARRAALRIEVRIALLPWMRERRYWRPLLGWPLYAANLVLLTAAIVILAALVMICVGGFEALFTWHLGHDVHVAPPPVSWRITVLALSSGVLIHAIAARYVSKKGFGRFVFGVLRNVELRRSLINGFFLRNRLRRLFENGRRRSRGEREACAVVDDNPMPLVIVASPLQTLPRRNKTPETSSAGQVWARKGAPLLDALRTALAIPGLFAPGTAGRRVRVRPDLKITDDGAAIDWEGRDVALRGDDDLVDGSVVRQNPLPALFGYLHRNAETTGSGARVIDRLAPAPETSIHVVFNVPTKTLDSDEFDDGRANIVDVTELSLTLARRRDTQMEIHQTNTVGQLDARIREVAGAGFGSDDKNPVLADAIAPDRPLAFRNRLDPRPDEILRAVASGCRSALEQLYTEKLRDLAGKPAAAGQEPGTIACPQLLAEIAQGRGLSAAAIPGLPEVCSACSKSLAVRPVTQEKPVRIARKAAHAKRAEPLPDGHEPQIVLVASGGVFRGAFHIGMFAALVEADIAPDLVVGASVGTLMGGAFAAQSVLKKRDKREEQRAALDRLVSLFVHVDQEVALTKTLKDVAREVGIRGARIDLSPADFARMVRRGSRADAAFAVAGAPPVLIDAISTLFLIPRQYTRAIASRFVAGHVSEATRHFLKQVKRETLRKFRVEEAVLGASLLERIAEELLSADSEVDLRADRQPYLEDAGIRFYGTATDLGRQALFLLGDERAHVGHDYDVVRACLASSAFPGVFAPRRISEVFPSAGRRDGRYADGGIFDNLPFLPAFEMLAEAQRRNASPDPVASLRRRHERPDLFIVGALNVNPEDQENRDGPYRDFGAIVQRARSLQENVKIRSFERFTGLVHERIERLLDVIEKTGRRPDRADTLDDMVDAAVLPIFPSDTDHLNGTFAFCATTGLDECKIHRSIANGCFQTLRTLVDDPRHSALLRKSLGALRGKRLPVVVVRSGADAAPGHCPYFEMDIERTGTAIDFTCPFAGREQAAPVYDSCRQDPVHRRLAESTAAACRADHRAVAP